ncbi:ribonucleotide reductase of class Ia (aerobic), beta subunit [Aeromonas phage Akh-2]|nr:ribonucleotide reductase of class Ia (aerobic), beta subunit [Aeromonas phage Akh-2]
MSLLNLNKEGKDYLFLGEQLGLQDYITVKYTQLEELALRQRSQFWLETEIPLHKDIAQWPELPKEYQELCIKNLAFQVLGDSLAGRIPGTVLTALCSNEELEGLIVQIGYFESLHSRSYTHIIKSVMPDAEKAIKDEIRNNPFVSRRVAPIAAVFDELYEKGLKYQLTRDTMGLVEKVTIEGELRILLIKAYFALYFLEAVLFYTSFAQNFGLANQDILQGIANILTLIIKDEFLHANADLAILGILAIEWPEEYAQVVASKYPEILAKEIMEIEAGWADYSLGDTVMVGLSAPILKKYSKFVMSEALKPLKITLKELEDAPKTNPIPWVDKFINLAALQVAPQETQILSYRVGAIEMESDEELQHTVDEWLK